MAHDKRAYLRWFPEAESEEEAIAIWHEIELEDDPFLTEEELTHCVPPWITERLRGKSRPFDSYKPGDRLYSDGEEKVIASIEHMESGSALCTFEDGTTAWLAHYGTPRHSGRYPWGSGDNPYQRNENFLGQIDKLRRTKTPDGKRMFSEKQIAESFGMTTTEYRKRISLAQAENRAYLSAEAKKLRAKGMSVNAIGKRLGRNESSVRLLLDEGLNERMSTAARNATVLKERFNDIPYIQVGKGVNTQLGISKSSFDNAVKMLENEGYNVYDIKVEQMGTGKQTTVRVLTKPGVEWKEVAQNKDKIGLVKDVYSEDHVTLRPIKEYVSVDKNRVDILYKEDGGAAKDGVIELRRGVKDLSLGANHYAQARILVDGDHYLKGMAIYSDDLPPGVDIRFNTSKTKDIPVFKRDGAKDSVLKPVKEDLENPFGANLKPDEKLTRAQRHYIDDDGQEKQSAINIVKEEGDVNDWSRTLSSQFLGKQPPALAKQQLKMKYDIAQSDYDEIMSYSNPTVKAAMLEDFAGRCESDAVHLSAAALPRQRNCFILPLTNIKENEVYAPQFRDGEQVALVRHPHASITEIPILTVNNNNNLAKSTIGDALDAVGIHPAAAAKLSGADFDGDTVLVLPTDRVKIQSRPQYKELEGFADKMGDIYAAYDGMKPMTKSQKGMEMGKVSNLITDMTIRGANDEELAMALKHSMVVIDAEKHNLNFRQSEIDNHIAELKAKYQTGGASTLLSRTTSDEHIPERKEKAPSFMTPEEKERYKNGELIYEDTGRIRKITEYPRSRMTKEEKRKWDSKDPELQKEVRAAMIADGREKRIEKTITMTVEKGYLNNPYDLVSGGSREGTTPIERIYADYAVQMKDLARQARASARAQEPIKYDPQAAKLYSEEVKSLKAKVYEAEKNAPMERQAQLVAETKIRQILRDNPELKNDNEHLKREKTRQLSYARQLLGAGKKTVGSKDNPLTDREWKAIQSGAISNSMLKKLLSNSDKGRIKELALPRQKQVIAPAKLARAKTMKDKGYTRAEIADMLDIPESRLVTAMNEGLL